MSAPLYFKAPWCLSLRIVSMLGTAVLVGVAGVASADGSLPTVGRLAILLGTGLVLALTALWTIRGYELSAGVLRVQRLLWMTHLPLAGLVSATADATATRRSLRLWGNGGLFAINGLFWNRRLGRYRMFATDPQRAVVLRYGRGVVIVTPDAPELFVTAIRQAARLTPSSL